jgi:hypothetical protein
MKLLKRKKIIQIKNILMLSLAKNFLSLEGLKIKTGWILTRIRITIGKNSI